MSAEWSTDKQEFILTKGRLEKDMFSNILFWQGRNTFYDVQS